MKSILIVGGGIIGQFAAYYLSKDEFKVTVIDENAAMPQASVRNRGLETPSHIAPLNSMGMIMEGVKSSGKKDAPLYIRPQLNGSFLKWFLSFVWRSRTSSFKKATLIRHQLLQRSWKLYSEFFETENNFSEWKTHGIVYACKTQKGLGKLKREVEFLMAHQLNCEMLSTAQLLELVPSLKEDVVGGAVFYVGGWVNPAQLSKDLQSINQSNGVQFIYDKINDFSSASRAIRSANGDRKKIEAQEFVLCSGTQSVSLAKKLGIKLPIIPGKGYNLTTSVKNTGQPLCPVYLYERKVVATPWESGLRLGSTMEFTGVDLTLNQTRLDALKSAASEYLNLEFNEKTFEPWAGWRPMSSHGYPIIERSGKFSNLIFATGHGMLGLSMAPATGMIVKELIAND